MMIPESERTENGDSPQEELASLVKGGANAKGYTLTEYVNDVNRENTEVLAEYKVDGTMRQAYTYGESGNGERIGVDKVDYYMYDGRGSVTGLVTDSGKLTNSYTYDPYGTLTSGTADAVNYYGYNAESTITKTGLQYLRARYYDPENGNFTSEDTEDGELPFPLTRNRYVYALNNPLNYKDPTGHKSKAVGKAVSGVAGGMIGGVMGSIWGSTKTVKKVDKPVKNIASSPKRATQRETGNKSGAANGHSKGGSVQASGSTGNKAGNMAAGDVGKLAGMSGVTGNQRSNYKAQRAQIQLEQSKRVTCAVGQKNASVNVMAGPIGIPLLWQALMALGTSVLIVAGVLVAVVAVVYLATTLLSQGKSKEQDDEDDGDTASDGDVAPSESGTPSSGQDNNNEPPDLVELAKTALQKTRNTVKTAKTIENVIRGGTACDLRGDPVPREGGGYFDHRGEMLDSYKSLSKVKESLEGSLRNPNLSEKDRALLQEGLDTANEYLERIEEVFEPYGGIERWIEK